MKKFIFIILLSIPYLLCAQSLSIQDLWNQLDKTNSVQQKKIEIQLAAQESLLERLNRFPIIYGEANLQRNLITPTTPVPAIAFDPNASQDAYLPLKFATNWNSKAGVQLEWKVFSPTQKIVEQQKQIKEVKANIEDQQNYSTLKVDATLAYASIVLASLQFQSAVEDSLRYHQIAQIIKLRYQEGRETLEQLMSSNQDVERSRIKTYETWSVLKEANLELLKYTDLTTINQLSTGIDDLIAQLYSYKKENFDALLLHQDLSINALENTRIKKQLLPTISLNGYYGAQFFNNDLYLNKSANWYGNSYVNLSLRLPLSDYATNKKLVQQNNLETNLNKLKLKESIKNKNIDEEKREEKIKFTNQKIQGLKKILGMSEEVIRSKKVSFDIGKTLLSDYKQALINHNTSLRELWQAQYDLLSLLLN